MTTTDRWTPPGYYVPTPSGACAHCGAPLVEHTTRVRFCPRLPLDLQRSAVEQPAA